MKTVSSSVIKLHTRCSGSPWKGLKFPGKIHKREVVWVDSWVEVHIWISPNKFEEMREGQVGQQYMAGCSYDRTWSSSPVRRRIRPSKRRRTVKTWKDQWSTVLVAKRLFRLAYYREWARKIGDEGQDQVPQFDIIEELSFLAMTRHRSEWLRWGQIFGKTTSGLAMQETKIHASWMFEAMLWLSIPEAV